MKRGAPRTLVSAHWLVEWCAAAVWCAEQPRRRCCWVRRWHQAIRMGRIPHAALLSHSADVRRLQLLGPCPCYVGRCSPLGLPLPAKGAAAGRERKEVEHELLC